MEYAIGAERALCDDAFAFLEQVRKNTGEEHGDAMRSVSHDEAHRNTVRLSLQTALLHQPADPEAAVGGRLVRNDLTRAEEEHEIALERVQNEHCGAAKGSEARGDQRNPLVSGFHGCRLRPGRERRVLARCRSHQSSPAMHTAATAYEP